MILCGLELNSVVFRTAALPFHVLPTSYLYFLDLLLSLLQFFCSA